MPRNILGVKLYTMEETAELLGVMKPTITNYSKRGRLSCTIIGGKKYFSEDNIKAFLQQSV